VNVVLPYMYLTLIFPECRMKVVAKCQAEKLLLFYLFSQFFDGGQHTISNPALVISFEDVMYIRYHLIQASKTSGKNINKLPL